MNVSLLPRLVAYFIAFMMCTLESDCETTVLTPSVYWQQHGDTGITNWFKSRQIRNHYNPMFVDSGHR